ncbi:MAG: ADP-ribosyltransferase [Arcicella sp.]|nr:ADP-ribosyltransferase [Arcicella sp.]
MTTEEYAKEYLTQEIQAIENSNRLNVLTELTVYEKAIIYKYSEDGYLDLNERLRISKGKDISDFGLLLDEFLSKLPDYQGIVFRGVNLPKYKIDEYFIKFERKERVIENAFLSTSLKTSEAYKYGTTVLQIFSRTGKSVESISRYPYEKEILFRYNRQFEIVAIDFDKEDNKYFTVLEEI